MPTFERYLAIPAKSKNVSQTYLEERVRTKQRADCDKSGWTCLCSEHSKGNQYMHVRHAIEERTKRWSIFTVRARALSNLEAEFNVLADQWRHETGVHSSLTKILSNWNYLKIIALGEPAIPLILEELRREPAPWFVALEAITGEHNVGREFAGNFRKMSAAWLAWGADRGYL